MTQGQAKIEGADNIVAFLQRLGMARAQPNAATDLHLTRLGQHFDEREQVEIMAVIAMFGFLNRWNETLATSLQPEPAAFASENLAQNGWDRGSH